MYKNEILELQEISQRQLLKQENKKEIISANIFLLENSMDKGAWWVTVCGAAKGSTWLSN